MIDDTHSWRIVPGTADFDALRNSEHFAALLNLARALNALRFCQYAYLAKTNDDSPSGTRQRLNAFLFNCAALYETFAVIDRLGRYFREHDAFSGFLDLQRDRRFRRFRESVLNRIRHKITFHFDPGVAQEVLPSLSLEQYAFAESRGRKSGDVYYDLADTIAVNYILSGISNGPEEEPAAVATLVQDATDLTLAIMNAGEHLIGHTLEQMGWQLEKAD